MWRNVCLLLWLCSSVAVHGSEAECKKRLDVISPEAWMSLREMDYNLLRMATLVNVADVMNSDKEPWPWSIHIAWHTIDGKTFLQGSSPCFDTGHGSGPRELVELNRRGVNDIQFGEDFIAILATDGTVWTAGCNENFRLGHHGTETRPVLSQVMGLPPIKKLAAAAMSVTVIASNGTLYSWGHPVALGHKADIYDTSNPEKVTLANGNIAPKAIDVCCAFVQCVMVTEDLKAYSWGPEGHIGRPYITEKWFGIGLVAGIPEDQRISKVACGHVHTLAVTTSGRTFGWGFSTYGSLMNTEDKLPYATELYMEGKIIHNAVAGKFTSIVVTDSGDSHYFGLYWGRPWYSLQPTADHVVFPRDILGNVQYRDPYEGKSYDETRGAVSLGCK